MCPSKGAAPEPQNKAGGVPTERQGEMRLRVPVNGWSGWRWLKCTLDADLPCAYIGHEYESAQKPQAVEKASAQSDLGVLRVHCLRANTIIVIPTRA